MHSFNCRRWGGGGGLESNYFEDCFQTWLVLYYINEFYFKYILYPAVKLVTYIIIKYSLMKA